LAAIDRIARRTAFPAAWKFSRQDAYSERERRLGQSWLCQSNKPSIPPSSSTRTTDGMSQNNAGLEPSWQSMPAVEAPRFLLRC